jgi:hypothetical protein
VIRKGYKWTSSFLFSVSQDYGKRGPIFYSSNEIPLFLYGFDVHSKIYVWSKYTTRVNGPNTAYGEFYFQVRWPSNKKQWFGWHITKHFKGNNAGLQARGWLNYMLKKCPCYITIDQEEYR